MLPQTIEHLHTEHLQSFRPLPYTQKPAPAAKHFTSARQELVMVLMEHLCRKQHRRLDSNRISYSVKNTFVLQYNRNSSSVLWNKELLSCLFKRVMFMQEAVFRGLHCSSRESLYTLNPSPSTICSSTAVMTAGFWEQHSSGHHTNHPLHLQSATRKQNVLLRRRNC